MDDPIRTDRRQGTVIVTLNRPEKANAYDAPLLAALRLAIDEIGHDRTVRAVIFQGAGRHFCAGADLGEIRARSFVDALRLESRRIFDRIAALAIPTIAAIHGAALGGGLELALACDLRLAATDAIFGLPETSLGIIPAAGGTFRLPRIVGLAKAKELVFTGRRIDAATALRHHLVNEVVTEGTVLDAALALATEIEANDLLAIQLAKQSLQSESPAYPAVAQALLYHQVQASEDDA